MLNLNFTSILERKASRNLNKCIVFILQSDFEKYDYKIFIYLEVVVILLFNCKKLKLLFFVETWSKNFKYS